MAERAPARIQRPTSVTAASAGRTIAAFRPPGAAVRRGCCDDRGKEHCHGDHDAHAALAPACEQSDPDRTHNAGPMVARR